MSKIPPLIIHDTRTEYVTKAVHEHRAPTDASVALLREMESAAKAAVIEAVHVKNTEFECVVRKEYCHLNDVVMLHAVFRLNGKQAVALHTFRPRDQKEKQQPILDLCAKVAEVIAFELIGSAFDKIDWRK